MNQLKRIINFLKIDIWRVPLKNLSRGKSFFIRQLRIILLTIRDFDEDKCMLRASSLTFYSLLSVVPVVAMAFGIAKGFNLEIFLENQLLNKFPGQEEVMVKIVAFAHSLLENTRGGMVAGIGVAILFWVVIKMLGNIEQSLNDIWGIKKSRSLGRKFSDYLSIMLICPLLLVMSGSITVFIASQIKSVTESIALLGALSPIIFIAFKLFPYCVIWILFTFLYVFMPNTKVNFKSGILAGIIAGTIYQILQWAYIAFQIGVARYNAIYGSFSVLPLFLVWLQLSWLIVLFGAEISFAHQHVDTYEFEPDCLEASNSLKILLSLWITHLLIKNFCKGEKPSTANRISHTLEIPTRLVQQLLYELTESGIISETRGDEDKSIAYQPAKSVDKFTIKYVLDALDKRGTDNIPIPESRELDKLTGSLKVFNDVMEKSPANISLRDI